MVRFYSRCAAYELSLRTNSEVYGQGLIGDPLKAGLDTHQVLGI